jgi:hypothetical protein
MILHLITLIDYSLNMEVTRWDVLDCKQLETKEIQYGSLIHITKAYKLVHKNNMN